MVLWRTFDQVCQSCLRSSHEANSFETNVLDTETLVNMLCEIQTCLLIQYDFVALCH